MNEIELKNIFSKKEMCYFAMIDKYFKKCSDDMILKMINIIDCNDDISLRILDWFVTRYAKKGVDFPRDNGDIYDVHINYKAQLKSYKKRYFDPFRRKNKFHYKFTVNNETKILLTTIGQLNFFAWAISNNILSFVDEHLQQITKAMNLSNKEDKKKKASKIVKNNDSSNSTDDDDNDDDDDDDDLDYDSDNDDNKNKNKPIRINTFKKIDIDEIELTLSFN
jgi:hypothetical protein